MNGLSIEEKLAVHFATRQLAGELGSQIKTATRLNASQQTISKVMNQPLVSEGFARSVCTLYNSTLGELVRKFRNEIDGWLIENPDIVGVTPASAGLAISEPVIELVRANNWMPLTALQLELWMRATPSADPFEAKRVGLGYDELNRASNDRLELQRLRAQTPSRR